ncbi:hypothetical protein BDZ91DRAFT_751429 [Kalaharituber pfeilii]|nr:hypothetical protein BDZ91DRAFT_751429 [Kalaharituber pfeilii]
MSNVDTITRSSALAAATRRKDPEGYTDYGTFGPRPILVSEFDEPSVLFANPFVSPLVFENSASDARDHCANERNFLSWLRLSIYLAILSIAITISFHLGSPATALEQRMALPLGLIFWLLSLLCLCAGLGNYLSTVEDYRKKRAKVQHGIKTQIIVAIVSLTIIATCIIFISKPGPDLPASSSPGYPDREA